MALSEGTKGGLTKAMRWSARVVGTVASGLFLLFLAETAATLLPALSWTSPMGMPLFLALTAAVAGVLIAWRREALGGAVAVIGALAVVLLAYLGAGPAMVPAAVVLVLPLLVAGILHLTCCWNFRATRLAREPKPRPQPSNEAVGVV